jgi:hypothetical protein
VWEVSNSISGGGAGGSKGTDQTAVDIDLQDFIFKKSGDCSVQMGSSTPRHHIHWRLLESPVEGEPDDLEEDGGPVNGGPSGTERRCPYTTGRR